MKWVDEAKILYEGRGAVTLCQSLGEGPRACSN